MKKLIINEASHKRVGVVDSDSDLMALIQICVDDLASIGLIVEDDITYSLIDSSRTFGCITLPSYQGAKFNLAINRRHINDPIDTVADTILHEFAHYFQWKQLFKDGRIAWGPYGRGIRLVYGSKPMPHGSEWKYFANYITVKLKLKKPITATDKVPEDSDMLSSKKYIIKCRQCGNTFGYERETKFIKLVKLDGKHTGYLCSKCRASDFELSEEK